MVHHTVCPLCSSDEIFPYLKCEDHFISNEEFDLYRCQACEFLFTQNYPEEKHIGKYYESDDYISHSDSSKGIHNKIYHLVRKVMLNKKKRLIKKTTGLPEGSLLDIGSGTGHFSHIMKEDGWKVKGVEINDKARELAVSSFDLEIIDPGEISSLKENSFDCITLWHVLEHFHDPFKYASEVIRLLKPEGICVIASPNCDSYDAKYYRENWAAFDVPRHLWHFTTHTFRIFSSKTGFTVENKKTLPLDVFYISVLSERYKNSKFPFLAGMLKAIPFAFLTLFNLKRSSSVIYILRKT